MNFSVLHPVNGKAVWRSVLAQICSDAAWDPHFSPEYLAAEHLADPGVHPTLAVYDSGRVRVIKPFVMREVNIGARSYGLDIVSPHGYGGPLSDGGPVDHLEFDREFVQWCKDAGVICEYMALNPMHIDHQRWLMRCSDWNWPWTVRKQVVWMDLTGGGLSGYHDTRLAGIKAARNAKVQVVVADRGAAVAKGLFVKLYREAMERKGAATRWRFSDEYLLDLCRQGTVFVAWAPMGMEPEAAALVLDGGDVAYYHMAARAQNSLNGANDLLVHEIASWCADKGIKRLHLGGGVTAAPDDGVLFFKSGFSDLRAPAMSTFRVFDEVRYRDACAAKAREEIEKTGAEFTTTFEPLYRREAA